MYWFLGESIFKDHRNCLDDHKDYVLNDIVKPKSMSVISDLSRVNYMCEIIPYLQAPSDIGETARKADYNSLQSKVDARVICRAQYNGLPKIFQNELEDCRVKWRTLSDSDWHDKLVSIERKEQRDLLEEKRRRGNLLMEPRLLVAKAAKNRLKPLTKKVKVVVPLEETTIQQRV
jgi:hypothetical protein